MKLNVGELRFLQFKNFDELLSRKDKVVDVPN
jgi:hypothetical protein